MLRSLFITSVGLLTMSCSGDESYDHGFAISASQWALANQQADLKLLQDSAKAIESWHAQAKTGILLNSPLSDQQYGELVGEFPCALPQEVQALWKWKNGESTDYFIWYHGFLSLEDAIRQYNYLLSEPIFGWQKNWIPFFQFQDEWYFVECKNEPTAGAPVIHYFTESGPSYAYTNLTMYLATMAEAMDRGVLTWREGWWNDLDDRRKLVAIHDEYNDLAKFPYAIE